MLAINLLLVIALSIIHFSNKSNMDKPINTKDYPGVNAIFKQLNVKEQNPIPNSANTFDDLPQSHKDGSNQNLKDTDVKVGKYGKTKDYKATIALVGSSHSEHWLGGFIKAAEKMIIEC